MPEPKKARLSEEDDLKPESEQDDELESEQDDDETEEETEEQAEMRVRLYCMRQAGDLAQDPYYYSSEDEDNILK